MVWLDKEIAHADYEMQIVDLKVVCEQLGAHPSRATQGPLLWPPLYISIS